jgi:hypothetical protein
MIAGKLPAAIAAGLSLIALAACGTGSIPAAVTATPKAAAASPKPLPCRAAMSATHPADDSTDLVHVTTASRAQVTAIAHYGPAGRDKTGQAGRRGHLSLRFHIGHATSGRRVQVTVTVTSGHRSGTCSTFFTLHKAPPAATPAPVPAASPAPAPSQPAAPALTCQASMSDASPSDYTDDDVDVITAPDADVTTVAYYKTTSTTESGQADSGGNASIGYYISGATVGYTVDVSVTVTAGGQSASCSTSFTPSG